MTSSDMIALISAAVALVSLPFAALAWMNSGRALMHQVLVDVQNDYRSPEMMNAVESLWSFYREYGAESFAEEYEKLRKEDRDWLQKRPKHERATFSQGTLHYQRRIVSHFYQHLADLYRWRIVPKQLIYMIWSEPDLEIIPKILIPIENRLGLSLQSSGFKPLGEDSKIMRLYNGSKQFS